MHRLPVALLCLVATLSNGLTEESTFFYPEPCSPLEGAHPNELEYELDRFLVYGWPLSYYSAEKAFVFVVGDTLPSWSIGVFITRPPFHSDSCLVFGAQKVRFQDSRFLTSDDAQVFAITYNTPISCTLAKEIEARWNQLLATARERKDPPGIAFICPWHGSNQYIFRTRFGCAYHCREPEPDSPSQQAVRVARTLREFVHAKPDEAADMETRIKNETAELGRRLDAQNPRIQGEP